MIPKKALYLLGVSSSFAVLPMSYLAGKITGDLSLWCLAPIVFAYGLVPAADLWVGLDLENPTQAAAAQRNQDVFYLRLVRAILPLQLVSIACSAWVYCSEPALTWWGKLGVVISAGTFSAVFGITAAHELIHKLAAMDRALGGLLLSTVCYGGFKLEHVRGHHVNVATPHDNSTARRGQSVYGFVLAAPIRNTVAAWQLAKLQCERQGHGFWHWRNELIIWHGLSLAIALGAWLAFGLDGVMFFVLQALVAISMLEIVNYVEHYGLLRRQLPNGRYERPTALHSWNANHLVSNVILFQLQRHSDHHANAARPYQSLRHDPRSPQLPAGYAVMMLLTLVPPLWRRVMHPRLDRLASQLDSAAQATGTSP